MKYYFILALLVFTFTTVSSQNFTGQWKGEFTDKSVANVSFGSDKCEYVLEIEVNNNKVTGTSYTYFTEGGIRYYTICTLEGFVDPKKKYLEVTEIKRTKTNIPSNIPNCFQVHKLTYYKNDKGETLEGNWIPAPNQSGSCGFGVTNLSRRTLVSSYPNSAIAKTKTDNKKPDNPVAKITKPLNSTIKDNSSNTNQSEDTDKTKQDLNGSNKVNEISPDPKIDQRKNTVIKTIEVDSKTIKVDLYDNGDIDGDFISLFYNGKLLLSNKKLTDKAITLNLDIDDEKGVNELLMYAENLGSIPPNTALMVVTDGTNRYEVRITSDLEKSGVIRFVRKSQK